MTSALRAGAIDIVRDFRLGAGAAYQASKVEHALWDNFTAVHLGQGHQLARNRDIKRAAEDRSVPSAQQNGLTPLEPGRIRPTDGQRRDVVQRGLDGHDRLGETYLASGGSMGKKF